jgi:hypothetical protein
MNWVIAMFFIVVVFILYLLRRYDTQVEGFEDSSPNIFDKVSMCGTLSKQINVHADTQAGLVEEKAVNTLNTHNIFMDTYKKKYDELGCANVKPPPT